MNAIAQFVRTTIVGGLLFLAPIVVLIVILAKAFDYVSTPEQDCIAFRSKDASMMPTRKPSSTGLSRGRQVGGRSSLGVSALLRRERRLL
jgi:uncharacterized membrane protein